MALIKQTKHGILWKPIVVAERFAPGAGCLVEVQVVKLRCRQPCSTDAKPLNACTSTIIE